VLLNKSLKSEGSQVKTRYNGTVLSNGTILKTIVKSYKRGAILNYEIDMPSLTPNPLQTKSNTIFMHSQRSCEGPENPTKRNTIEA
jgi:hypothetical protein